LFHYTAKHNYQQVTRLIQLAIFLFVAAAIATAGAAGAVVFFLTAAHKTEGYKDRRTYY
jgi:hypothetical protein